MFRKSFRRAVILLCIVLSPVAARAQDLALLDPARSDFISSPPGFRSACARYDWLCGDGPEARATLTEDELFRTAQSVNRSVNGAVEQVSDARNHGTDELWVLPERGRGDCEDFALEKMRLLLQHGVPSNRLSMAIVLDRRGNNHAVLLVRARAGYLVLDNLTDRILSPAETGYRMLAMQAHENRMRWTVADAVAMGSASSRMPDLRSGVAERRIASIAAAAIRDQSGVRAERAAGFR